MSYCGKEETKYIVVFPGFLYDETETPPLFDSWVLEQRTVIWRIFSTSLDSLSFSRWFEISSMPSSRDVPLELYLTSPNGQQKLGGGRRFWTYICIYIHYIHDIYNMIYVYSNHIICISNIGIEKGERKHQRAFNFLGGCTLPDNMNEIQRSIVERVALRKVPRVFHLNYSKGWLWWKRMKTSVALEKVGMASGVTDTYLPFCLLLFFESVVP